MARSLHSTLDNLSESRFRGVTYNFKKKKGSCLFLLQNHSEAVWRLSETRMCTPREMVCARVQHLEVTAKKGMQHPALLRLLHKNGTSDSSMVHRYDIRDKHLRFRWPLLAFANALTTRPATPGPFGVAVWRGRLEWPFGVAVWRGRLEGAFGGRFTRAILVTGALSSESRRSANTRSGPQHLKKKNRRPPVHSNLRQSTNRRVTAGWPSAVGRQPPSVKRQPPLVEFQPPSVTCPTSGVRPPRGWEPAACGCLRPAFRDLRPCPRRRSRRTVRYRGPRGRALPPLDRRVSCP